MATKKTYTTFVSERAIDAPRQVVWDVLLHLLGEEWAGGYVEPGTDPAPHGPGATTRFRIRDWDLTERTITLEPPWRRVYEVEGAPVVLYQGTIAIRDDGPSCYVAWAALVDPLPDGVSDAFLDAARAALTNALDQLATRAESAAAARTGAGHG